MHPHFFSRISSPIFSHLPSSIVFSIFISFYFLNHHSVLLCWQLAWHYSPLVIILVRWLYHVSFLTRYGIHQVLKNDRLLKLISTRILRFLHWSTWPLLQIISFPFLSSWRFCRTMTTFFRTLKLKTRPWGVPLPSFFFPFSFRLSQPFFF